MMPGAHAVEIVSELAEDAIDGESEFWFDDLGEYRAALEQAVDLVHARNAWEVVSSASGADYDVLLTGSSFGDEPTPTMKMFYWINACQALWKSLKNGPPRTCVRVAKMSRTKPMTIRPVRELPTPGPTSAAMTATTSAFFVSWLP